MKQHPARLPQRRLLAVALSLLNFGVVLEASAADVQINTPPAGNFVVKDNAGAVTLLKVDGSGVVTVPCLATAPATYSSGVCFGADLAYTVVGRATGTSEIFGASLITTNVVNSVLTVRNPAGNSIALSITPLAGGTRLVSAHITITQVRAGAAGC